MNFILDEFAAHFTTESECKAIPQANNWIGKLLTELSIF